LTLAEIALAVWDAVWGKSETRREIQTKESKRLEINKRFEQLSENDQKRAIEMARRVKQKREEKTH